mgnify:CR=1 FL=1
MPRPARLKRGSRWRAAPRFCTKLAPDRPPLAFRTCSASFWMGMAPLFFRNISNAGQDEINPGLNSNIIATGVTFTY